MTISMSDLRQFRVPDGELAVWWLGQAGFLLKSPGGVLAALDPYLSDSCGPPTQASGFNFHRSYPPPLPPAELAGVDLYAVTHSHQDHLDPETLAGYRQAGGDGPYLAPAEAEEKFRALGVSADRITSIWPRKSHTVGDLTFRATLAIPYGGDDLTHVGYLVSAAGGPTFYFTGDTAYHEVMGITVAEHKPDVMLAVINGTFRNLGPAEVAELAARIKPRVVIPYHHDMFPDGRMPPRALWMNLMLHEMQDRFRELTVGQPWVYGRGANT